MTRLEELRERYVGKYVAVLQADESGGSGIAIAVTEEHDGIFLHFDWGWSERILDDTTIELVDLFQIG